MNDDRTRRLGYGWRLLLAVVSSAWRRADRMVQPRSMRGLVCIADFLPSGFNLVCAVPVGMGAIYGFATMTDTSDLVERLRKPAPKFGLEEFDPTFDVRQEAVITLEAQAKEIERLNSMLNGCVPLSKDGNFVFIDGAGDVEIDHEGKLRARAETTERELEAANDAHRAMAKQLADRGRDMEAFQRHEQTLRDNGIASHSEAVVLVTTLRRERDEARAALKRLPQHTICDDCGEEILHDKANWADDGSSYCRSCRTLEPMHTRAARAVTKQGE